MQLKSGFILEIFCFWKKKVLIGLLMVIGTQNIFVDITVLILTFLIQKTIKVLINSHQNILLMYYTTFLWIHFTRYSVEALYNIFYNVLFIYGPIKVELAMCIYINILSSWKWSNPFICQWVNEALYNATKRAFSCLSQSFNCVIIS